MSKDPTAALLAEMARHGLNPGAIAWDNEVHRFDGPEDRKGRKSGWYRAFVDQRGAVFGDHKTDVDEVWQLGNGRKPDDLDPKDWGRLQAEWAGQRKAREAEREQEWERIADECRKRYAAAKPADPSHAYLVRRKIQPGSDLKQEGELLLVPMRDVETGKLMSLQTISADGEKLNITGGAPKGPGRSWAPVTRSRPPRPGASRSASRRAML